MIVEESLRKEWTRHICKFDLDAALLAATHERFKDIGVSLADQIYLMEVVQDVFNKSPKLNSSFEEIGREFVRLAKDESSGIDDLIELRNKAKGLKDE